MFLYGYINKTNLQTKDFSKNTLCHSLPDNINLANPPNHKMHLLDDVIYISVQCFLSVPKLPAFETVQL